ncbi:MAG TPA: methyltransferase domain-containing protein [Thermodesulfobacteriota bacterium]|nr:methyltransferase domain-containing protein [Thermodesulfobacteriota bacterium]
MSNKEGTPQILSGRPNWYQRIQILFSLETKRYDRSQILNQIFPPDLKGASVINIGCEKEFFCLEAKKRNAGRVVGIDIDCGERLSGVTRQSKILGADIEFLRCDINGIEELGIFDYVLCFNALHRVKDPIHFIFKLINMTRRKLVLDIADLHIKTPNGGRRWWNPLFKLLPSPLQTAALAIDSRSRLLAARKWIEQLFQNQYSSIERVEFLDSGCSSQFLVLVSVRKLSNLRIISGPSGVGKTVFIDRLRSGDPEVVRLMDFNLQDGWQLMMAKDLKTSAGKEIDKLLLHYNITKPIERIYKIHNDDPALIITRATDKVVYVLVSPPDVLIERVRKRVLGSRNLTHLKRAKWLISQYLQPGRLRDLYENWILFCKANVCELKYIDVSSEKVKTLTEEEALRLVG